jgi:hypothetical protein
MKLMRQSTELSGVMTGKTGRARGHQPPSFWSGEARRISMLALVGVLTAGACVDDKVTVQPDGGVADARPQDVSEDGSSGGVGGTAGRGGMSGTGGRAGTGGDASDASIDGDASDAVGPMDSSFPTCEPFAHDGGLDAGTFVEFLQPKLPAGDGYIVKLAAEPEGDVWYTNRGRNAIGHIALGGPTLEFPVPAAEGR